MGWSEREGDGQCVRFHATQRESKTLLKAPTGNREATVRGQC